MRYAYAITAALLLSGTAAAIALPTVGGAQTAQNEPAMMAATAPKPGAPMSFADLVAKLQPAVVNISTSQRITQQTQPNPFAGTPFEGMFGQQQGQGSNGAPITREATSLGSGFIISPDGYVVTNNHVVAPAAGVKGATVDSITVTLIDRKEYVAKLIGRDPTSDLALLKIDAKNLPFVKFGDSDAARVGDWVLAIGNPFGLGGTVTAGIVSSLHRVTGGGAYDRFIQTDAAINQGNSGGPMFDLSGNVIGINSQILGSQGGGNIGIGFAIPAVDAKPVIDKLMKGTTIARGYLGVGVQPLSDDLAGSFGLPKNQGELIGRIEPGQAADKAGLKAGDIVLRVGGKPVTPDQSLSYLVANVAPGARIPLDIVRQGKPMTITAAIGTRPPEDQLAALGNPEDGSEMGDDGDTPSVGQPAANALGVTVQTLTPPIARNFNVDSSVQGVVIANVDPSSDAGSKGLKRGDVIVSVNGVPVATPAALGAAITQAKAAGRAQVALQIVRGRAPALFIGVKLKK
ncbi:trypsin-like peptidase domain-containing protein [Sphingomonas sp.]|uniref:trypsin-like peptidase domain-containing protein n=1 Tax=Sphingomonas sp. TaxID=28214 RepID=UPI003340A0A5